MINKNTAMKNERKIDENLSTISMKFSSDYEINAAKNLRR